MDEVWRQKFDVCGHIINQMERININFGPVRVTFSYEQKFIEVGHALKNWLGESRIEQAQFHIEFLVSPSVFENVMNTGFTQPIIRTWAWDAVLVSSNEGLQVWVCNPRMTPKKYLARALPKWLFRFFNPLGASYWELQAGYLLYHIVLKVIQSALLKNEASFVHAAGLSNSFGNAVLICGRGGVGKTTTAAYFCSKGHWTIIADDFVILSQDGIVYGSHLPAHIYGYHMPILEQLGLQVDKLFKDWLDKLHWNIYSTLKSPAEVVRRVTLPEHLMSPNGIIKMCFIVESARFDYKEASVQSITQEEAAYLALQYTLSEIQGIFVAEEQQRAVDIICRAFRKAMCYRIIVPQSYKGSALARIIWEKVAETLPGL